jgi:ATP-dependent exoDNAse (exonuclease V) beta subunit
LEPFPASGTRAAPPETPGPMEAAMTPRAEGRPSGRRFGTLVHSVLRDADLEGDRGQIASLARAHGRVLGAPDVEMEAAVDAVMAALEHPLVRRWTIVDFKSDAHLEPRRAAYERQLAWYVYALGRISGLAARGWLLGV